MTESNEIFKRLLGTNVNDHVDKKQGLSYLSWPFAWAEVKKIDPEATYTIWKDGNNRPYIYDSGIGYMVFTTITIGEITHEMWLPVMNSANRALKAEPYEYEVTEWKNNQKTRVKKSVEACNMFDINKTIMRCLVKNIAMFGLGLYIFAGEDVPTDMESEPAATAPAAKAEPMASRADARALIELKTGTENWKKVTAFISTNKHLGFEKIVAQLKRKYTLTAKVSKEIEKLITD